MLINRLISPITYKILIGIVLTASMIISLFYLSQDLHVYLGKFENGDLIQLSVFCVLFALFAIGLFMLFMKKENILDLRSADTLIVSLLSLDYKVLGVKFIEGFLSGLTKETEKKMNKSLSIPISEKGNKN